MTYQKNARGHHLLRKGRVSVPNRLYFLTIATVDRQRFFESIQLARITASCCHDKTIWLDSQLMAWVLMPDHWHGLVCLGETTGLSSLVQRFKSISTKRIKKANSNINKVWQSAFYDHALRSDEVVEDIAKYMLNNPIRAGMVESLGDYPYWNVEWEIGGQLII